LGTWHIITGEYPPQNGGVSDYTFLVADGLASAGESVHVWAPASELSATSQAGVEVHRLPGHFGPSALTILGEAIRANQACAVLVQYVPHAYGCKAMNLPFCLWLRSVRRASLTIMFHEVAFPLRPGQPYRHKVLGVMTHLMARIVCRSATKIMVASERWKSILIRLGATAPISWVPVPSNITVVPDEPATAQWRQLSATPGGLVLGHFANYCEYSVKSLSQVVPKLLDDHRQLSLLLLGARSGELRHRLLAINPGLDERIFASGALAGPDLSSAMAACDIMLQPYPDGVSTRRGSMSALLAHGCTIVTTEGIATERLWSDSGAVTLVSGADIEAARFPLSELLSSYELRCQYGLKARRLYHERFALRHTLSALLA
jgi:glycosyltransferase involved in cell wall biosynthesis